MTDFATLGIDRVSFSENIQERRAADSHYWHSLSGSTTSRFHGDRWLPGFPAENPTATDCAAQASPSAPACYEPPTSSAARATSRASRENRLPFRLANGEKTPGTTSYGCSASYSARHHAPRTPRQTLAANKTHSPLSPRIKGLVAHRARDHTTHDVKPYHLREPGDRGMFIRHDQQACTGTTKAFSILPHESHPRRARKYTRRKRTLAIVIDKVPTTGHSASERKTLKTVNIANASYPVIMPCTWQCRRNAPRQSFAAPPAIGHHEPPYVARGSRKAHAFHALHALAAWGEHGEHEFSAWGKHEFSASRRAALPAVSLLPEIAHTARRTAPVAETCGLLMRKARRALQSDSPRSRDTSYDSAHTAAFSRTLHAETPLFAWSHQAVVAGAVDQPALSGPHQNRLTRKALAEKPACILRHRVRTWSLTRKAFAGKLACIGQSALCGGGAFAPDYLPGPANPIASLEAPPVSPGTTTATEADKATETDTIRTVRN